MRVALVTEYYYPHLGGVTEHVENLAQQLRLMGHVPVIITGGMRGADHDASYVRRVGRSRVVYSNGSFARVTTGVGLREAIARVLRDEGTDVAHLHGAIVPTLGLTAQAAASRVGVPIVATFHSWFPRSVGFTVFRRPLQRRLDAISAKIAVSAPVVDALSRYFHADWDVIPNGVNTLYFHPNGRNPRDALVGTPRLLFLGRLDPRNGLDTMLAAMPAILRHHPRTQLVVAGDGPLGRYYRRMAAPLGDRVRFVGHVYGDRDEHYGSCDIYVCPTTRASFGITLLEAMASGRPMIVSDIIGFRELVTGTGAAIMVPPGKAAAWADAAVQLIGDVEARVRMGAAGRAASNAYAWSAIARRVADIYERVSR